MNIFLVESRFVYPISLAKTRSTLMDGKLQHLDAVLTVGLCKRGWDQI